MQPPDRPDTPLTPRELGGSPAQTSAAVSHQAGEPSRVLHTLRVCACPVSLMKVSVTILLPTQMTSIVFFKTHLGQEHVSSSVTSLSSALPSLYIVRAIGSHSSIPHFSQHLFLVRFPDLFNVHLKSEHHFLWIH